MTKQTKKAKRAAAANAVILPTQNECWGAWGTAETNGLEPAQTWAAMSAYFQTAEGLSPEETRELLDSRFGRHMVDDLSFAPCGGKTVDGIERHLARRFAQSSWRQYLSGARRQSA